MKLSPQEAHCCMSVYFLRDCSSRTEWLHSSQLVKVPHGSCNSDVSFKHRWLTYSVSGPIKMQMSCVAWLIGREMHGHQTKHRQETQLSLTNRATHLYKCNDVTDLTSVIKICLKIDSLHPAFQGHSRSLEPTRIDRSAISDFLLVFYSNFVPKTHRFWDIRLQKCRDLESGSEVTQGHWKWYHSNR